MCIRDRSVQFSPAFKKYRYPVRKVSQIRCSYILLVHLLLLVHPPQRVMCTTNNSHRCSLTQLLVVWPLEGVCHAPHSNFSCILSALLPLFSFRDGRFAIFYFSLTYPSAPEILILSCDHGLYSEAVSYEEYFRQIFGLSGSKKVVENIPRKYYLGNMGSVLDRFLWEQKVAKKVKVLWQLLVGNFGQ